MLGSNTTETAMTEEIKERVLDMDQKAIWIFFGSHAAFLKLGQECWTEKVFLITFFR